MLTWSPLSHSHMLGSVLNTCQYGTRLTLIIQLSARVKASSLILPSLRPPENRTTLLLLTSILLSHDIQTTPSPSLCPCDTFGKQVCEQSCCMLCDCCNKCYHTSCHDGLVALSTRHFVYRMTVLPGLVSNVVCPPFTSSSHTLL